MTISTRTLVYRSCWILALLFASVSALAAIRMGPAAWTAALRLPGFPAATADRAMTGVSGVLPLISGALCSVYGVVVLFLLSYRYSRTISMELFFFAFFALALAAEPLRLESLRGALWGASFPERNIVTRVILTARLMGAFSLFAGSLYAVGYTSEKHEIAVGAVFLCALALGTGLPINTGIFGPDLIERAGYGDLHTFLSMACILGGCANYLFAVRITGERGYRVAALGCALAFSGSLALRGSASPAAVLLGALALCLGTILFLRKIHAYYLWQ